MWSFTTDIIQRQIHLIFCTVAYFFAGSIFLHNFSRVGNLFCNRVSILRVYNILHDTIHCKYCVCLNHMLWKIIINMQSVEKIAFSCSICTFYNHHFTLKIGILLCSQRLSTYQGKGHHAPLLACVTVTVHPWFSKLFSLKKCTFFCNGLHV